LHCCLGLYLASRIDVLPAEFCREFALIPDAAPALTDREVHAILNRELGGRLTAAFATFEDVPYETRLLLQVHRARLRTGAPVAVAVRRPWCAIFQQPEPQQVIDADSRLAEYCGEWMNTALLADFINSMQRKTDFTIAHNAMDLMARDASSCESLLSHKSYAELGTRQLVVFEPSAARPLDYILQRQVNSSTVLGQLLCQVWLQQALYGRCFPVDPHLHNILISNKQVAFIHCDLAGLPNSAKENLQSYFNAILVDDPDQAAKHLLLEMVPGKSRVDPDAFRTNFRQAAYFGMLEPVLGTDSNALAQIAFQHWKTALENGYLPKNHLLCFYRGLFSIARIARLIAPEGDPLRLGMEELRSTKSLDQIREIMDVRYWYQNMDKFAAVMVNLPRTFDDALSKTSSRPSTPLPQTDDEPAGAPREKFSVSAIVLLLLAILVMQLRTDHTEIGKFMLVALMLVGIFLFRGAED
jgi:predicted unusual protein kinase regulating ubiquinone biosynthesis (AarF/ABC1/UbiB family)